MAKKDDSTSQPKIKADCLFKLLTKNGSQKGKRAFIKLCGKGCDPRTLGQLLMFLGSDSTTKVKSANSKKQYQIEIRPMDSLESASKGFEKRDLVSLQKALKKMAERVEKFQSTRLLQYMQMEGELNQFKEALQLPRLLNTYAKEMLPLLIKRHNQTGPKLHPDYKRLLTEIYKHIYECTEGWEDALVSDILNDLETLHPDKPKTAQNLKVLRSSWGLVEKKS